MAGILNHVWGVSPAQDRVWAQVSGIALSKAGERLFVVLQAFIDDSYDTDGVFVLAGYIASAEAWAEFSKEWEQALPSGTLNKGGKYHFKMKEMAESPERMGRVPGFYRIIEKHTMAAMSCTVEYSALERAKARISVPGVKINYEGFFKSPYRIAFRALIDAFHAYREEFPHVVPLDEKVDFYFDEQSEKKTIRDAWDEYLEARPPEIRKYYGVEPRFEDDKDFVPIQAADFLAWWVRKWYADGKPECLNDGDFYTFRHVRKPYHHIKITTNEDLLVATLIDEIRPMLLPGQIILDKGPSSDGQKA